MVGIVVVSHSGELARGLVQLASQMAGDEVSIEHAGGTEGADLGTSESRVREAIARADGGEGVVVLGDLGSAFLTARHVLERRETNSVRLVDAPLVEGTISAAVAASAGAAFDEVVSAAEGARGASKF